jgi:hypothetical protein
LGQFRLNCPNCTPPPDAAHIRNIPVNLPIADTILLCVSFRFRIFRKKRRFLYFENARLTKHCRHTNWPILLIFSRCSFRSWRNNDNPNTDLLDSKCTLHYNVFFLPILFFYYAIHTSVRCSTYYHILWYSHVLL